MFEMRKNKFIKKLLLPFTVFIILCCLALCFASRQPTTIDKKGSCIPTKDFDENYCQGIIDSLELLYSENKIFIDEYKLPCLVALSFYPELREVDIHFVHSKESTTMAARPIWNSIFSSKRSYNIFINNNEYFEGILLSDVPFNAQLGVIGHEIAHVLDYENQNFLGIMRIGIDYLDVDKKIEYERSVDMLTISKGLGWQLHDWAQYSMYESLKATESYKEFKRKTYMNPTQIVEVMKNRDMYELFFTSMNE
jgi:hypothetical protein